MPTLSALLADLETLPIGSTLYAAVPWSATSEAACSSSSQGQGVHVDGRDLAYLLEVEVALEVVDVWVQWRGGRRPSDAEACEAVIHYAQMDAYLPVEAAHDPNDS